MADENKIEVVEARVPPPLPEAVESARKAYSEVAITHGPESCGEVSALQDALEDLIASATALDMQYKIAAATIYKMHVAATGDPNQAPVYGLVEDIAWLRQQTLTASKAARAAVDGWEAFEVVAGKQIKELREARDRAISLITARLDPRTDALLLKQLETLSKQGD